MVHLLMDHTLYLTFQSLWDFSLVRGVDAKRGDGAGSEEN